MVAPRLIASLLSSPNQFSCNVNGAKSGSFYLIRDVTVVSTFPSILSTAGNLLALPTASVALLQDAVASDFLLQWNGKQTKRGKFLLNHGSLAPNGYNYSEVRNITKFFSDKLGRGGYGSVYKGMLSRF
ncbi:Hypothetical predicted protein [Olea europaea subsp. europaea]|uniref:Uncharacterized protein n=1 Tax=Olea europaea subsp. europaea TaxID=158383 RepID=A0A8S0RLX5_OLEEU|nr:Hypothetical predicted protein [Olea europaea subsp. europaea]